MFKGLHYIIAYNIKRLAATQMSNENETVINYGTSIQWSTMQVFKNKKDSKSSAYTDPEMFPRYIK